MNYYEHHLGDYAKDAGHLSLLEDGAYRRLLDAYYTRERPLPADIRECCKLARASSKPERDAVAYVLREFFEPREDGYHQSRADAEIARFQDKQRKAAASANARWSQRQAQSDGNANAHANAMRTHNEGNAPCATHADTGAHPSPVPSPQSPTLQAELAGSGSAPSAVPQPPPAFDGRNAEALNGKAVVPMAHDWELPEQWGLDAEALGWKPPEVLREAEKLRQWATEGRGKGTRRNVKGWRQTWSNWLEKAARDKR